MEQLVLAKFFPRLKGEGFFKQLEKIATTELHIAVRVKESFPYNFGVRVIYAATGNIPSVSDILNKGRLLLLSAD